MIGRLVSFWDCLILGAMLNFWGVYFFRIPIRQALVESGAALDESCLVRELLVDVPENPALQGMDLESWSMISGEPRKQASYLTGCLRGILIYNP